MKTWTLATVAAVAFAGAANFALAAETAPAPAPAAPPPTQMMHPTPAERMAMMLDMRLGGMKAALRLSAEQEKNWAGFEAAVRDVAKAREEARAAMREQMKKHERPNSIEFMNRLADGMARASANIKKVADAAKPLYDSLNEQQKMEFGSMLQMLSPGAHGEMEMMGPGPWDGPKMEGPGPWGGQGPHGGMGPMGGPGPWGPQDDE